MTGLGVDLRYALRLLMKDPISTALTVVLLSGGIALSVFTFSLLYTTIYKGLPEAYGDRIVKIFAKQEGRIQLIGARERAALEEPITGLELVGAYMDLDGTLFHQDLAHPMFASFTEPSLFQLTDHKPILGRTLQAGDGQDVVVISYPVWQEFFGGDAKVLGRSLDFNGVMRKIVGVMPEGYALPVNARLWMPLPQHLLNPERAVDLLLFAKYVPDADRAQVQDAVSHRLKAVWKSTSLEGSRAELLELPEAQIGEDGFITFAGLNGLSLMILLLASVNVGNLLLARGNLRSREIGIRIALGAPKWQLLRQVMMEQVLICVFSGLVGILAAGWALDWFNQWVHGQFKLNLTFWWHWYLDLPGVAVAVFLVFATLVPAGLIPSLRLVKDDFNRLIRDGSQGAQGRYQSRFNRLLVVLQTFIISVVLYVIFIFGLIAYHVRNLPVNPALENSLLVFLNLTSISDEPTEWQDFYRELREQLESQAKIDQVILQDRLGFRQIRNGSREVPALVRVVEGETAGLGLNLIDGQFLDSPNGALVSESLARGLWGNQQLMGQNLWLAGREFQVQGVIAGQEDNLIEREGNMIYVGMAALPTPWMTAFIKHRYSETGVRQTLFDVVNSIDSRAQPFRVTGFSDDMILSSRLLKFTAGILVAVVGFALLLALIGIYGLVADTVRHRTHEIGLRRALGAPDGRIVRVIVGDVVRQMIVGMGTALMICIPISIALVQFLPLASLTFVLAAFMVVLVVTLVVVVAATLPARRAVAQEPHNALRYQ